MQIKIKQVALLLQRGGTMLRVCRYNNNNNNNKHDNVYGA